MARSHAIWVVMDPATGIKPVFTATVKHELATWLNKQSRSFLDRVAIWRYPDGDHFVMVDEWKWESQIDPQRISVTEVMAYLPRAGG